MARNRKRMEEFKKKVEFYLRYKDKPELFAEQEQDLKKEMINKSEIKISDGIIKGNLKLLEKTIISLDKYNEWLFKLAFKEVIEK